MAGNETNYGAITRDVTQTNQALTTTPDYQSPNGFGAILQGVTEGFGNLISGASRGAGKSSGGGEAYNTDLYNLYKGASEELSASNMSEEQFIMFDKQLHQKALALSGGDYGAIDKAMSLAQYKPFAKNLEKLYTRDAANQYAQMDLVNAAGTAAVGVDAPADVKEREGYNYLNRQLSSNTFVQNLAKTSPSQQTKLINSGSTPGLTDTYTMIMQGFDDVMRANQGANPGVLFNNYYNATVSNLTNGGMDFAVASKLVDRALVMKKAMIYGEGEDATKASTSFGRMSLAEDYMSKQNKLEQDLADSRLLAQEFTLTTRVPGEKGLRTMRITGADLAAREKNFPNTIRTLTDNQYLELVPQLFNEGPQTYRSTDLNFMVSDDAGNVMNVNGDDESGKVNNNIASGQNQLLDTTIKEKEELPPEQLRGKGFADITKLNKTYSVVKPESVKNMDSNLVLDLKDKSFKSIAKGTNAESGKEGFWQVDDKGQLHYYTGTMWAGDYILLDSTDSTRFMGLGAEGAENMRRYAPEISKWLNTLENVYGIDKQRLYEDFNRSQIRDTVGAQSFRVNQLRPSAAYYRGATMEMSEDDVNSILEAVNNAQLDIEGVSVGIGERAAKDVLGGIRTAAEEAGKLPGELLTRGGRVLADELGITKAAETLTDLGLAAFGGQEGRKKAMDVAATRASQRETVQPITEKIEMPAQAFPFAGPSDYRKLDAEVEMMKDFEIAKRLWGDSWYEDYQKSKRNSKDSIAPAESASDYSVQVGNMVTHRNNLFNLKDYNKNSFREFDSPSESIDAAIQDATTKVDRYEGDIMKLCEQYAPRSDDNLTSRYCAGILYRTEGVSASDKERLNELAERVKSARTVNEAKKTDKAIEPEVRKIAGKYRHLFYKDGKVVTVDPIIKFQALMETGSTIE